MEDSKHMVVCKISDVKIEFEESMQFESSQLKIRKIYNKIKIRNRNM